MKKILSVVLVLSLVLTASAPSFGAAESSDLEKAILKAKSIIYVSPSLTAFNFSFHESDGRTVYNLDWHDNDYKNSINAGVTGDYLTYYSRYSSDEQNGGLGSVSRETGLVAAKAFLAKINPVLAAKMKEIDSGDRNMYGHNFFFILEENGKPVDFVNASVNVSSHTGEISYYGWEGLGKQYVYPSDSNIITEKAAMDAYLSNGGIKLEYRSWYDYEKQELQIIPAYTIDGNFGIDANNGKKVLLSYNSIVPMYAKTTMARDSMAGGGEMGLSEVELGEVAKLSNLLTKESALAALTKFFPAATGLKLESSSLSNSREDKDEYFWNLYLSSGEDKYSASATVNAKSGEVYSWSYYKNKEGIPKISRAEGLKIAKEALQKLSPSKSAFVKFSESEKDVSADVKVPIAPFSAFNYSFTRQVSGIPFNTDYISINVDAVTGDILSYHCNWHTSAKFPELKNIIPLSKAAEIYAGKLGFGLKYGIQEETENVAVVAYRAADSLTAADSVKKNPLLLYSLLRADSFSVDPYTGKLITSDGKDYTEKVIPHYRDLGNHWAKDIISILLDNGYYIGGEDFQPNSPISQEAFFRYLYANQFDGLTQDQFYDVLKNYGLLLEGEKNPQGQLSRYEVAKYVVRYLKEQKLASYPDIFVNPFNDEISDVYKGYAAIVKAFSIMKGDQAGNFNGDKVLSRGEAAVIIYNTLQTSYKPDTVPDMPVRSMSVGTMGGSAGGGGGGSASTPVALPSPSAAPVN
ncbi:hypothetical protein FACS1894127_2510 [Clostridia bacterium]|nr:hypothetical protein FACS1894127_2510 [Clostridia bacterium]